MSTSAKPGDVVRVKGFQGVACYFKSYAPVWAPDECYVTGEDGEEYLTEDPDGGGMWEEDTTRAVVVMVGDDHEHTVDIEDLSPIEPDEYCDGCGQIGCGHGSQRED